MILLSAIIVGLVVLMIWARLARPRIMAARKTVVDQRLSELYHKLNG